MPKAIFLTSALLVLAAGFQAAADDGVVRVAVMAGLTGDSAQFGKGELDAVRLAAEEWNARGGINGQRIELDVEDTATSAMRVVSGFKRLTEVAHHTAILGPTWVDTFQAIVPLAERRGVLLLSPCGDSASLHPADPANPMALTVWHSTLSEAQALLAALQKQGVRRVVASYTEEPYFQMWRTVLNEQAQNYGITIAAEENFDFAHTDYKSFMLKAKQQRPDCLLLLQTDEASVRAFIAARNQLAAGTPIAGCHDFEGFLRNEELRRISPPISYSYFKIADDTFPSKFEKRFGYPPALSHPNAYDAANMLFTALAAGKRSGVEIRDYLLKGHFKTVTFGETGFTSNGGITGAAIAVRRLE